MDPSPEIHFDRWTLLRRSGELLRDGSRVRLQLQPLQVLEELLAHPGELVTREQLIARLWPKGVVDFDTALNSAVRRLRQTLGDDADTPRYIATVARRGYRFIGTVTPPRGGAEGHTEAPVPPAEEESSRAGAPVPHGASPAATARPLAVPAAPATPQALATRPPWWPVVPTLLLLSVLGLALWGWQHAPAPPAASAMPRSAAAAPTVAVLPFVDMSPQHDQQYFAEGLAEEVINLLAQAPGLRVTARTSSFALGRQDVDIATIARKLNVTHVIEGSVRRSGDRVRITAQLVEAATAVHLWSQTYDRRVDDALSVQSDIASAVASTLQLVLHEPATPASINPLAYDRVLLAHYYFQRRGSGDLEHARLLNEQALAIDPRFARAWAGLASIYWIDTMEGRSPMAAGLEQVRAAAEQALTLDPRSAEAHVRLGLYLGKKGDRQRAQEHIRMAALLEPNNPLALSFAAEAAAEAHRIDDAIALQRRAVLADPMSNVQRTNLADLLLRTGRTAEARAEALKLHELDPANPDGFCLLCFALVVERKFDAALDLVAAWPPASPERLECLALASHGLGHTAAADAALAALTDSTLSVDAVRAAEVHAFRGDTDLAFQWLQTAAERSRSEPAGSVLPTADTASPFLAPLRNDKRWKAWLGSVQPQG